MTSLPSLPKVSIVIVVRNAVNTIEKAIKSVLGQEYSSFELIILDGLSTDGTIGIIEKYMPEIAFFSSEKDNGIYDAMNKSIKNCSGEWIYFLGADDELMDQHVLSKVFSHRPKENEILYGDAYYLHKKTVRFGKMNRYSLSKHNFNHQTVFYPSSVFEKYTYQTKYKIWADYFVNIQLYFKSNYNFTYIHLVVSKFNDLGTSGASVVDTAFEEDRVQITKEIFPPDVYIFYTARNIFRSIQKMLR